MAEKAHEICAKAIESFYKSFPVRVELPLKPGVGSAETHLKRYE
jgi:hypothetical protein